MKRILSKDYILLVLALLICFVSFGQEEKSNFFKGLYKDFLQYGTLYGAGDARNSIEAKSPIYFVRTNPNGSIYSVPTVEDNTPNFPFDYRIGIGILKK